MGVSIDIRVYDYESLIKQIGEIADKAGRPDRTVEYFEEEILPKFGFAVSDVEDGDTLFISMWNEFSEDYNLALEMMQAVDLYFGVEDTYLESSYRVHGANAYEVLDDLGIEPIGVDNDEEV